MRRRVFVIGLVGVWSQAQAVGSERLVVLNQLLATVGAAAQAMSQLAKGLKDWLTLGQATYSVFSAERERSRLIAISKGMTALVVSQNAGLIQTLDHYLGAKAPTENDWARVLTHVESTLVAVQVLLKDLQAENGAVVLEPVFLTLNQTLSSRTALLDALLDMPVPHDAQERQVLHKVSRAYKVLIANATQALNELNRYVKSQP